MAKALGAYLQVMANIAYCLIPKYDEDTNIETVIFTLTFVRGGQRQYSILPMWAVDNASHDSSVIPMSYAALECAFMSICQ